MGNVHNHGPDEGRGIRCPEREIDGQLWGQCLIESIPKMTVRTENLEAPSGYIIARGAFKKAEITNIPITHDGEIIGRASMSEDGETINMELDSGCVPGSIRQSFLYNMVDGLSLDVNRRPMVMTKTLEMDLETRRRNWFGKPKTARSTKEK